MNRPTWSIGVGDLLVVRRDVELQIALALSLETTLERGQRVAVAIPVRLP